MGGSFPTTLQRTSDERWVTLQAVSHDSDRLLAHVLTSDATDRDAVVRIDADESYDRKLRNLVASPPPDTGSDVVMSWPVDLLHDLDASAVGYVVSRITAAHSFPLGLFVDPATRAEIAPFATRRHLLRVARNTAIALAALHHAGHAGLRVRNLRLDDRARLLVVRIDELQIDATAQEMTDDRRWLGRLAWRLLEGRPWALDGQLGELLRAVDQPLGPPASADEWFHALHDAEQGLLPPRDGRPRHDRPDKVAVQHAPVEPKTEPTGENSGAPSDDPPPPEAPGGSGAPDVADEEGELLRVIRRPRDTGDLTGAAVPGRRVRIDRQPDPADQPTEAPPRRVVIDSRGPSVPAGTPAVEPARRRRPAGGGAADSSRPPGPRKRRATDPRGGHTKAGRARANRLARDAEDPARVAFATALALIVASVASVAPFATFVVASALLVLRAALRAGQRRSTMGPAQTAAITLTRLIPFATGGFALAAFVLFDLLLLLGLAMAIAQRLFEYGPGFTLSWVVDLPEVPGLVRGFAFAVGGFVGLSVGGDVYDGLRGPSASPRPRRLAVPALGVAVALSVFVADAGIVWWPFAG